MHQMSTRFAPLFDFDLMTRSMAVPSASGAVPMDAVRTRDAVEIRFDLPGYDPGSIDLSVEKNVLTLSAERNWILDDDTRVLLRERRHGSVKRQIRLSDSLDPSRVEASFDNGVLNVRVPVAETAQPHKVDISIGSGEVAGAAALEEGSEN
jgi:HSP20 family protein